MSVSLWHGLRGRFSLLNPPSICVSIPAYGSYTFALDGLVCLYNGYGSSMLFQLYDNVNAVWRQLVLYGRDNAFLSKANYTGLFNNSSSTIYAQFTVVGGIKVSYRVASVPANSVYLFPDNALITVLSSQSRLEVYDGTTWRNIAVTLLMYSNGSNVRENNITTSVDYVTILSGVIA